MRISHKYDPQKVGLASNDQEEDAHDLGRVSECIRRKKQFCPTGPLNVTTAAGYLHLCRHNPHLHHYHTHSIHTHNWQKKG